jgi:CubicO group peptidase (beta-lactamase class C family)
VAAPLLLALVVSTCAPALKELPPGDAEALGFSRAALAAIAPVLQAYVDSGKYAGITAVISRHGQIAYLQSFGWMDIEKDKRMQRAAVFRIYSMTKPITAAGLLKLVDEGMVSLDDPVAKYIPAFANMKVFVGGTADQPVLRAAESPMTLRQVLTHTSGLAYGTTASPVDTIFNRAKLYDAAHPLAQFADSLARLPLMFSPGNGWNYSSGIDLIGRVIEVISGEPLDRFLDHAILRPLDMRHTGFRKRGYLKKQLAVLYERSEDGKLSAVGASSLQAMFEPDAKFFWGSGGLLSTVDDYLRFTQMLLNHGELDGKRVLSRASVAAMTHNQLPDSLTPLRNRPEYERGYGYGLAMSVLVDSTIATLPGPNGIYRWSGYVGTYFWNDPKNDLTAMVWSQLTPGRTYPLEQDFQRLVYRALKN